MEDKVKNISLKVHHEKRLRKIFWIVLAIIIFCLLLFYFVVGIIYSRGNFSINMEQDLYFEDGLLIYDDPEYKVFRTELLAPSPKVFDDMLSPWIPSDIANLGGGSHNGDEYLAYTFYIENTSEATTDYWMQIVIEDVIKNIDEAVRIRLYRNGTETTYAKVSSVTGEREEGTVAFASDSLVTSMYVPDFVPGTIDEYTLVIWVDGDDLECTDNILGGEFKVHMDFLQDNPVETGT